MYRRRLLGGLAACGAVGLAGCLGGEDGYRFDAEPARVPAASLSAAGYEGDEPEEIGIDEEFDVPVIDGRVSLTTWVAGYENASRGASLFVASTPNATVAGQSVNPLVRADDVELLRRLLDRGDDGVDGDDVDELEERESRTVTILESETTVTTFEAQADLDLDADAPVEADEGSIPAFVHVATVEHRDDVILLVGTHPQAVDEGETLDSLMADVEH
mgnify:CR=1 FL=1